MSLCIAMHFAAHVHLLRGEVQAAHEQVDALLDLAAKHSFALLLAIGSVYRGGALVQQGDAAQGIALLEEGIASRQWSAELATAYWTTGLVSAYGRLGLNERALALIVEAEAAIEATAFRLKQAEFYQLKGELLVAQARDAVELPAGPMAEAEALFVRAIETARRQQSKSLELRATTSLCRLWQAQGKEAEARSSLAKIYGWFSEGFETADLVEARKLLAALTSA
jgi:predicted ATPase